MTQSEQIRSSILEEVSRRPGTNPTTIIQAKFGISREAVRLHFKYLTAVGQLTSHGYGKARVYFLSPIYDSKRGSLVRELHTEILRKSGEENIHAQIIEPFVANRTHKGLAARIRHVATEMLNNVIDHSQSTKLEIALSLSDSELQLRISDSGIGVFESIRSHFGHKSAWEALGEIAKGKRTTDPTRHAGEGIFFSSRMASQFKLTANGLTYIFRSNDDDWAAKPAPLKAGSDMEFHFELKDERSPKDIFEKYTEDFDFKLKSPRLVLPYTIDLPQRDFPSRSEAKKILAGAGDFKSIVVDFKKVETIGQGFADEMFRVFTNSHPDVTIEVINANDFIQRMIAHVKRSS